MYKYTLDCPVFDTVGLFTGFLFGSLRNETGKINSDKMKKLTISRDRGDVLKHNLCFHRKKTNKQYVYTVYAACFFQCDILLYLTTACSSQIFLLLTVFSQRGKKECGENRKTDCRRKKTRGINGKLANKCKHIIMITES